MNLGFKPGILTIDTNVLIHCLLTDDSYAKRRPPGPPGMTPSNVTKALKLLLSTQKCHLKWALHEDQLEEILNVTKHVITYSENVLSGKWRKDDRRVALNPDEIKNAKNFYNTMLDLQEDLEAGKLPNVIYTRAKSEPGQQIKWLAENLSGSVTKLLPPTKHTDPYMDTCIYLNALHCAQQLHIHPTQGVNLMLTNDNDFKAIELICQEFYTNILSAPSTHEYASLPPTQKTFLKVACQKEADFTGDHRNTRIFKPIPQVSKLENFVQLVVRKLETTPTKLQEALQPAFCI